MSALATHPMDEGGAAAEWRARLVGVQGLVVEDRTPWPRFGLKGPGSAVWLAAAGVPLPEVNRHLAWQDSRVLRLGRDDVTVIAEAGGAEAPDSLAGRWREAPAPKGYSSRREDAWAWLSLAGPALDGVLARLCALDLRPDRVAPESLAQTRVGHLDAVVLRRAVSADLLFDVTSIADLAGQIVHAAQDAAR